MKKSTVYLRSVSCRGIKSPIPFQKPSLYASISLSGASQRMKTSVDAKNGGNPEWDCHMRFDISEKPSDVEDLFLQIDLTVQVPLLPDICVGSAHIPVSDLIDGESSGRVSYQVKGSDGKANGFINLWYGTNGFKLDSESAPDLTTPPLEQPLEPYQAYTAPPLFPNTGSINSIYPPPDATLYPQPPSNSGIYPPLTDLSYGSGTAYYPPQETRYQVGKAMYYPPVDQVGQTVYYPAPEIRYQNERGCDCRELSGPYPPSNGFYPPPPYY